MRRTLRATLIAILLITLTACVYTTETREAAVSPEYSVLGVNSFHVVVDCKNVRAVHVYNGFAEDFCPVLNDTVRIVMKERHPRLSYRDTDADLTIDISLEDIHFFIGRRQVEGIHLRWVYHLLGGKLCR